MYYKHKDCSDQNNIDCPRYATIDPLDLNKTRHADTSTDERQSSGDYTFLFVGCWGVYCKEGKKTVSKLKKGVWKDEKVEYGQQQVVEAMTNYSNINRVNSVILAGDNVYSDYVDPNKRDSTTKSGSYDIDKQLSEGFTECMKSINTDKFLIAIGNHDAESCYILNRQLNYRESGWNLPAMSYNIIERVNDVVINFVFIDTNMYTEIWCDGNPYDEGSMIKQKEWLKHIVSQNRPHVHWNIVIGHIPYIYNSHKYDKKSDKIPKKYIYEKNLYDCIKESSAYIDLYMCADEHNQQYITSYDNMPPIVIAGSGGSALDDVFRAEEETTTHLAESSFGFVSVNVKPEKINLTFHVLGSNREQVFSIDSKVINQS